MTEHVQVLRFYHSGVVTAWRARDRCLRALGCELTLATPLAWNEGGETVTLDDGDDDFCVPVRTAGSHPFRFAYSPLGIVRLLRRRRWDVLDIHEEPASLAVFEILLARAALRCKATVVLYSAENILKRYPPPFRWFERWALRSAAAVHCCNEDAARIVREKGLRGQAIVLGLGVDTTRFAPSGARHDGVTLGYVGRLDERKGVQVVIEALASVDERVELRVVGAGPHEAALRALADRLGLSERVRFEPYVDHDDLPARYRELDVVVVPSLPTPVWHEQFCRVAVEAMASGVPVIASSDGALPEVVGDGGVLVPPGDVVAWAAAIDELAKDVERRRALGDAAVAWAARFDWQVIARRQRTLYDEVRT